MTVATQWEQFRPQLGGGSPTPVRSASILVLLLASAAVWPKERSLVGDPTVLGEIAPGTIAASLYAAFVIGTVVILGARISRRPWRAVPGALLLFAACLIYFQGLLWPHDARTLSGTLHWLTAVAAWAVAAFLGTRAASAPEGLRRLAQGVALILLIEALVSLAQRAGININPMDPGLQALMGDRTNGTMDHPGNEGKNILLLMLPVLVLFETGDRRIRRLAQWSAVLALVPLLLSGGRANIVGVGVMFGLWVLLLPSTSSREARRWRVLLPAVLLIGLIPFYSSLEARWAADPEGGERPRLTQVGLAQISDQPLVGTGPNRYVAVVSQYDSVTARGNYPVHNVVLLSAAELGVPLAVMLWASIGSLAFRAFRQRRSKGLSGSTARSTLALLAGLLVVGQTGWGLASHSVLILWFLVLGFAFGILSSGQSARASS